MSRRSTTTDQRPGRPRREGLDQAILDATLQEMTRVGYAGMSLETIAHNAGTTKPTLYTRWPSKAALAVAALQSLRRSTPRRPTGEIRADLIQELTLFRKGALHTNGITMIGTVLAEEHQTPALLQTFRKQIVEPRRENLRRILQAGLDAGQLRRDAEIEIAITMLVGALYAAYLAGTPTHADWAERVVDAWLQANVPPRAG